MGGTLERMVQKGHLDSENYGRYWKEVKQHRGTTKAPTHRFAKLMKELEIEVNESTTGGSKANETI